MLKKIKIIGHFEYAYGYVGLWNPNYKFCPVIVL